MKRSCKNIDITNPWTIEPWVYCCLEAHKTRHDFRHLICSIGGLSLKEYEKALNSTDKKLLHNAAFSIAIEAAKRIRERSLNLPPVRMREKVDKSSGKVRLIGSESAMHQIFDHIATGAADEIWKRRIVPQQASSIKSRGQIYGARMIQRWIKEDDRAARWARSHGVKYSRKCKCFVKLDARKCYCSMRLKRFMKRFCKDCGNEDLLWLWEQLLRSHKINGYEGFMIGALPSQWACQYMMSFLYRYVMSQHKERRGKQRKLITHMLIYMDDIFMTAASRRDLKAAVRKTIRYAKEELGLTIKEGWQICDLDKTPIDMMGYVIHAGGKVTIRPRIFLRARRMALRCLRQGHLSIRQARRILSYKGYFIHLRGKYKNFSNTRKAIKN